jgi:hypothetical protein
VSAVRRVTSLDRAKVRAEFERRFVVERMARDYLAIYQENSCPRAELQRVRAPQNRNEPWHAMPRLAAERTPSTAMLLPTFGEASEAVATKEKLELFE